MSRNFIKIQANLSKILKTKEDGAVQILCQIDENEDKNLHKNAAIVEIAKDKWNRIKDLEDLNEIDLYIGGSCDVRKTKKGVPFIFVNCDTLKTEHDIRKKENKEDNNSNCWFKDIPEDQLIEIDINKVKLIDEVHIKSIIPMFNLKRMCNYKELNPIAVKEIEDGYELLSGIRSYIIAKIFCRNVKAYITDLSREEFKEKFNLEK